MKIHPSQFALQLQIRSQLTLFSELVSIAQANCNPSINCEGSRRRGAPCRRRAVANMLPGWITDLDGAPILDEVQLPERGQYYQLPLGGTREQGSHKGYGFAAVAEILSQIMSGTGAAFMNPGSMSFWFCAYKIAAFTEVVKFKTDMDEFLNALATTPPAPGHDRVLYAGLSEHEETQIREKEGIPYHREVIDWFRSLSDARNLGIVDLGVTCRSAPDNQSFAFDQVKTTALIRAFAYH